ncbi:MAG TPA: pyridoxal 5'-phosphate synthase [Solirubrobacteraceae bacterium]|nr:pyridoxal 5'-phosphate synthase [Solirubrobacteraceae bacterium]
MSVRLDPTTAPREPLELLDRWLADAREGGVPGADAVAFVTVGGEGQPTARTVSLKRLQDGALVFTSALWTRKARELSANPRVALLFHWPSLGRQVHVAGEAVLVDDRALAEQLFAERAPGHRVQTLVSRQGEPIDDLAPLQARHAHLMEAMEAPPDCPPDWGAIRVAPTAVEFWLQAPDRMHDRLLYERDGDGWSLTRLSP